MEWGTPIDHMIIVQKRVQPSSEQDLTIANLPHFVADLATDRAPIQFAIFRNKVLPILSAKGGQVYNFFLKFKVYQLSSSVISSLFVISP